MDLVDKIMVGILVISCSFLSTVIGCAIKESTVLENYCKSRGGFHKYIIETESDNCIINDRIERIEWMNEDE